MLHRGQGAADGHEYDQRTEQYLDDKGCGGDERALDPQGTRGDHRGAIAQVTEPGHHARSEQSQPVADRRAAGGPAVVPGQPADDDEGDGQVGHEDRPVGEHLRVGRVLHGEVGVQGGVRRAGARRGDREQGGECGDRACRHGHGPGCRPPRPLQGGAEDRDRAVPGERGGDDRQHVLGQVRHVRQPAGRVQPGADGRQVERADRGQEQHREPDRTPYPGVPLRGELGEDDDPEHRYGHGARGHGFNPSARPAWRRIRVSAAETSWTGMTAVARWARARMSEASSSASRSCSEW